MDVSMLGPIFYLLFILPGFVGAWSLLLFFGHRRSFGGFEWTCWSILSGIIVFAAFQWVARDHMDQVQRLVANPLAGTLFLSIFAFLLAAGIKVTTLIIKYFSLGILAAFAFAYALVDNLIEERRKEKRIEAIINEQGEESDTYEGR